MTRLRVPWQVWLGTLLVFAVGGTAVVAAYPSQRLLGAMFEADQKPDRALHYYSAWSSAHPADYDARWHTAHLQLATARPADAIATLEHMARDWPGDKKTLEKLVTIEDSLLRVRDVIPRLQSIAHHHPDDLQALRRLADHYRWFGDTGALLDILERLGRHPQGREERIELADILLSGRHYQRLVDFFSASPDNYTDDDSDPRLFVAEARKRMGQPEAASELLLAVLQDKPHYIQALSEIVDLWLAVDRPDMAERYITRATALDAETRTTWLTNMFASASAAAAKRGDRKAAIALAQRRIELTPTDMAPRLALADLHGRRADAVAATLLEDLSRLRPEDANVWRTLAQRLRWARKPRAALEPLERAVALAPRHHPTRRKLARELLDLGRVEEAIGQLRRIAGTTRQPRDYQAWFDTLISEGRYLRAVKVGSELSTLSPARQRSLTLAQAWTDQCHLAIATLRSLCAHSPGDHAVWRARRACAISLGAADEALAASSHLRKMPPRGSEP